MPVALSVDLDLTRKFTVVVWFYFDQGIFTAIIFATVETKLYLLTSIHIERNL